MPDRNGFAAFGLAFAGGDVMDSVENFSAVVAIPTFVTNADDDIL